MESERPLKRSIPDGHCDVVHACLFQQLVHLVKGIQKIFFKNEESTLSEENPARLTPSTWRI